MREIIYAWNYREWGGAQIYFMSLMKEAKRSYAVTALIPADSEAKILQYLAALDIHPEFLPPSPTLSKQSGLLGKLKRRIALMSSEGRLVSNILARQDLQNTIVHVDLGFWQSFLSLLRLCIRTNVFMTVHTGLPAYTGWRKVRWSWKGKLLSPFSRFHLLTSNQEARESLKPYISSEQFAQTEVTYSGIDPDEINNVIETLPARATILKKYDLPENRSILMSVGQFIERKGCWIVLESLKQLKDLGKDFLFVWLSTTLPDADIVERIETHELGDSFRLMGSEEIGQARADMLTLLSVADIFVLASLQEGLPIALIEAMALGLPCIATNVNAIPEAIIDGETGILIEPNNASQLHEAISAILTDKQIRKLLGAAARKIAFEKFNSKITAERTLKLYDQVWQTSA